MTRRGSAGVVFASTVGNALGVTPTVTAVFGVFLVAIASEFHWLRAEVSGALASVSIANALALPAAGWLADRIGARRTLLLGSLLLGLAILSLALTRFNLVSFYLQFIVIGMAGALPSGMLYAKLIAEWFESRRGLWIGIAGGVGNGLGATAMPLLAGALLGPIGWRRAFGVIALIILFVGLPIQYFCLRNAPVLASGKRHADVSDFEGLDVSAALRTARFWLLLTSLPIGAGCLIALFSMAVPIITDRGYSLDTATAVLATFALVCTIWEPCVGLILDHTTRPRILVPFYWASALGVLLLMYAPSVPLLLVSAVLLALGLGAEASALSFLLSRYFGRRNLGTISGINFSLMLGAGALMMVLINAAYDSGRGYHAALELMLPVLVWNGAAILFLGRYPFNATTDA